MKNVLFIAFFMFSFHVISQSTVKIGRLEVMTGDLGRMNWKLAKTACKDLGDGWRLPTIDELKIIYNNKEKIGNFSTLDYWSSTEVDYYAEMLDAWSLNFRNGTASFGEKNHINFVRAVRSF
jgi:hypothetical protein